MKFASSLNQCKEEDCKHWNFSHSVFIHFIESRMCELSGSQVQKEAIVNMQLETMTGWSYYLTLGLRLT